MRLLDLFCGEGLAAWGYWLSGCFSEIVGVDILNMSSSYSFDFIQGDALSLDYEFLSQFDFIHASPPCQAYSKITPSPGSHMKLIPATHLMLRAAGLPYVIENVEGSGKDLRPNLVMSGQAVGLSSHRPRYFHVSTLATSIRLMLRTGGATHIHGGKFMPRSLLIEAMGLSMINDNRLKNLTSHGIEQGIPPAMTLKIMQLLKYEKLLIS